MRSNKFQSGQTLVEVIVVITVGVLVIGALVFTTISSLRNAQFAKNQAQATKLAQEGIERVRISRDRNKSITGGLGSVTAWNSASPGSSIWDFQLSGSSNCGDVQVIPRQYCYFKLVDSEGTLVYTITFAPTPSNPVPLSPLAVEQIPPFSRAVILSDEPSSFASQKTVTVIVKWTDFSGLHESRLTTILRKI